MISHETVVLPPYRGDVLRPRQFVSTLATPNNYVRWQAGNDSLHDPMPGSAPHVRVRHPVVVFGGSESGVTFDQLVDRPVAYRIRVGVDAAASVKYLVPGDVGPELADRVSRHDPPGGLVEAHVDEPERSNGVVVPELVRPAGVIATPCSHVVGKMLRYWGTNPDLVNPFGDLMRGCWHALSVSFLA